jgi:hypothetical protein
MILTTSKNSNNAASRQHFAEHAKSVPSTYLAFIDQEFDGSYSPARLVLIEPKKNNERYNVFVSPHTDQAHISSYRRDWSHRNISTFKKKRKGGPNKENIDTILGSFLEIDGRKDNIKTIEDIYLRCKDNGLPTPSSVIETSEGRFHVIWLYERPISWNPKNERWWTSQQQRLIPIFDDFGPDVHACLNPVQFLRNRTQLNPFNYKRKCDVVIHNTKHKTSLGVLQRSLDRLGIDNPRIPAETIIRQDLRKNSTINETYKEWGARLGLSVSTMAREVPKLLKNKDITILSRQGNNKKQKRFTVYKSLIYQEPNTEFYESEETQESTVSEMPLERIKTKFYSNAQVMREFCEHGAPEGVRNKTVFICSLYLKCRNKGEISENEVYERLFSGFTSCGLTEKEYRRTIRSALKSQYDRPFSNAKISIWLT